MFTVTNASRPYIIIQPTLGNPPLSTAPDTTTPINLLTLAYTSGISTTRVAHSGFNLLRYYSHQGDSSTVAAKENSTTTKNSWHSLLVWNARGSLPQLNHHSFGFCQLCTFVSGGSALRFLRQRDPFLL